MIKQTRLIRNKGYTLKEFCEHIGYSLRWYRTHVGSDSEQGLKIDIEIDILESK